MRHRVRRDLTVSPPPDAYELAEARGYGLTASDLRQWRSLSAIEIHWAAAGFLPGDAVEAAEAGMTVAGLTPRGRFAAGGWASRRVAYSLHPPTL